MVHDWPILAVSLEQQLLRLTRRPHIEELYRRLHATGLIHGELQVRHVRHRLDTDALCLIDFDRACAMDEGVREAEWFQLMDRLEPVRPTSDEEEDLDCEEKEEEGYTSW